MSQVIKYWPIAVVTASVVASAAIGNFRISANAEELVDVSESVDENEENIEEIQRLLIARQGEVKLDLQRIETQQRQQGETLGEIRQLLLNLDGGN